METAAEAGDTVEGEGTPGTWHEEGGDETKEEEEEEGGAGGATGEGRKGGGGGGVGGGGGGVGQVTPPQPTPKGVWPCCGMMVTGEGAGNMGGPLGEGEGGFWVSGEGAAMGMSGRGPAAFPGGLLIMTGGEGGSGVKLLADHTTDLTGGAGAGAAGVTWGDGGPCCCLLGTVA